MPIIQNEEDFYSDFIYSSELKDLFMMFATCHSARPISNGYESNHMEEKALLNLAKEYGVVFDDLGELESLEHSNYTMNYYTI